MGGRRIGVEKVVRIAANVDAGVLLMGTCEKRNGVMNLVALAAGVRLVCDGGSGGALALSVTFAGLVVVFAPPARSTRSRRKVDH